MNTFAARLEAGEVKRWLQRHNDGELRPEDSPVYRPETLKTWSVEFYFSNTQFKFVVRAATKDNALMAAASKYAVPLKLNVLQVKRIITADRRTTVTIVN
jgi:hypothetical protein